MPYTTVATFDEIDDARMCQEHLEADGFHALVHDEAQLQRYCFLVEPHASKKVQVPFEEFEQASRALAELDRLDHVLDHAVRCPRCRSSRIEYPQYTRWSSLPILIEGLIHWELFPHEYYCQDCHYSWPRVEPPQCEGDILGRPERKPPVEPGDPPADAPPAAGA
jgi:hypothetical protein